jgi:hypothetical protein
MLKNIILLLIISINFNFLYSQEDEKDSLTVYNNEETKQLRDSSINTELKNRIYAPAELEKNIKLIAKKNSPTIKIAYTVQLKFDRDINIINNNLVSFKKNNPDLNIYKTYNEPNFYLKVGYFRTKMEASKLLIRLKKDYPGAYVVTVKNISTNKLSN